MNKPIMRPVEPEEDVEKAVEQALQGLKVEEPGQPMVYTEPEDVSHATLVKRSRASFIKQLDLLQGRIEDVNRKIGDSIKARDDAIHEAEKHHTSRLKEYERDLYQIKSLRGAVELAIAVLGYDE